MAGRGRPATHWRHADELSADAARRNRLRGAGHYQRLANCTSTVEIAIVGIAPYARAPTTQTPMRFRV